MKDVKQEDLTTVHGGTEGTAPTNAAVAPCPVPMPPVVQVDGPTGPPVLSEKHFET
jgi:hypothetical protein